MYAIDWIEYYLVLNFEELDEMGNMILKVYHKAICPILIILTSCCPSPVNTDYRTSCRSSACNLDCFYIRPNRPTSHN